MHTTSRSPSESVIIVDVRRHRYVCISFEHLRLEHLFFIFHSSIFLSEDDDAEGGASRPTPRDTGTQTLGFAHLSTSFVDLVVVSVGGEALGKTAVELDA